jgi:hypothetical protein
MNIQNLHLQQKFYDTIKIVACIVCITILAIIVTGCATAPYKPFKLSQFEIQDLGFSYADFVHVGDQVKIHTNDAKEYEFEVTSIDHEVIKGKDVQVSLTDISSVDRKSNFHKEMGWPDLLDITKDDLMEDSTNDLIDYLLGGSKNDLIDYLLEDSMDDLTDDLTDELIDDLTDDLTEGIFDRH